MPKATFYGLPHSESEVYYLKSSTIGLAPDDTWFTFNVAGTRRVPSAISADANGDGTWKVPATFYINRLSQSDILLVNVMPSTLTHWQSATVRTAWASFRRWAG